MEAMNFLIMI